MISLVDSSTKDIMEFFYIKKFTCTLHEVLVIALRQLKF